MNENEKKELNKQLFSIQRSVRYHMHRCRFYDSFHDVSTALTVLLGIGAIYATLSTALGSSAVVAIGAIISAIGIFDLVMGTTRKARLHNSLANKFIVLEKHILAESISLKRAKLGRLDIEKEEPPVLDVLNIICHNEVMTAMGYKKKHLAKIGWFQRLVSPLFDFAPHKITNP